jgi:hypothetical protein
VPVRAVGTVMELAFELRAPLRLGLIASEVAEACTTAERRCCGCRCSVMPRPYFSVAR